MAFLANRQDELDGIHYHISHRGNKHLCTHDNKDVFQHSTLWLLIRYITGSNGRLSINSTRVITSRADEKEIHEEALSISLNISLSRHSDCAFSHKGALRFKAIMRDD